MKYIDIQTYATPMGALILGAYEGKLCLADWRDRENRESVDQRLQKSLQAKCREQASLVVTETMKQLDAYFRGTRESFDITWVLCGTDFQQSVWKA